MNNFLKRIDEKEILENVVSAIVSTVLPTSNKMNMIFVLPIPSGERVMMARNPTALIERLIIQMKNNFFKGMSKFR